MTDKKYTKEEFKDALGGKPETQIVYSDYSPDYMGDKFCSPSPPPLYDRKVSLGDKIKEQDDNNLRIAKQLEENSKWKNVKEPVWAPIIVCAFALFTVISVIYTSAEVVTWLASFL